MNIKQNILLRVRLAGIFVSLFGVAVLFTAGKLIFVEGDHWRKLAEETNTNIENIKAARGNIYSDDGSLLATSIPTYDIYLDMMASGVSKELFNEKVDSLGWLLSRLYKDKSANEYTRILRNARSQKLRYFRLKRRVNFNQYKEMRTWPIFNMGKYKGGLIAEEKERRMKPFQRLAERTIGYVNEGTESVGLEGVYDSILSGSTGKRLMQKVAGGRWVPVNYDNEIEPESGKDIVTTIDINMQDVAEDALENALIKHNAKNGTVILMEVKTGEIKAIANLSRVSEGVYREDYNYAIGQSAEPGSTFKLVSLMALLEISNASLDDSVNIENGTTMFFDRKMKDSEPGTGGTITLQQAFEKSSNVGISKVVYKHFGKTPEKYIDYIKKIGMDKPLGLQINGEGIPKIKSPKDKDWYGTTLPWMSIGYESQITPMQTLSLYNAIANNGVMMKPILVKEIEEVGKTIHQYHSSIINEKVCSESTLEGVKKALAGVVTDGTGKALRTDAYNISGKTGTAQIALNGTYERVYKASFAGFFPSENPLYSCIVVINAPSNGVYYGGSVAGPVFRELADKVYANLIRQNSFLADLNASETDVPYAKNTTKENLKTTLDYLGISSHSDNPEITKNEVVYAKRQDKSIELQKRKMIIGLVPNVEGMSMKDAYYELEKAGLYVNSTGNGRVKKQSISAGKRVTKGSTVYIELR